MTADDSFGTAWVRRGKPKKKCAKGSAPQVPDPHGHLRGQRAGHGLAQSDAVEEVAAIDPAALFDQVALHVSDRGDRPAESDRAQLQEIPQYPAEPHLCWCRPRCVAQSRF
jgi:hypothetical protein